MSQVINRTWRLVTSRRFRLGLGVVLGMFVLVNAAIFLMYKDRTFPQTSVAGHHLGSVSDKEIITRLKKMPLLPKEVAFHQAKTSSKASVQDLGVGVDYGRLSAEAMQQRSWLPLANLLGSREIGLSLVQDKAAIQPAISAALAAFQRTPADARIARQNDSFAIEADSAGQAVDVTATQKRLLAALSQGRAIVPVATKSVAAAITSSSLSNELQKLNKQTKTAVTLQFNGQSKRLSSAEIAALYTADASRMVISDAAIRTTLVSTGAAWGIVVDNLGAATTAIRAALENQKDLAVTLVAAPKAAKTIRYCTAVRGVSESVLPELNAKLQSAFADSRGWGLGGLVRFEKVSSGCEMQVWLAAADQMPSFGAICDSSWSCMVSPNVVINYDRWRFASEAWNAQNGSLDDYRSMVINHEAGHWFGFYHSFCGGAGQPAPVMQQQSINLQGCTFNPWPTAGEQAGLKQRLGI